MRAHDVEFATTAASAISSPWSVSTPCTRRLESMRMRRTPTPPRSSTPSSRAAVRAPPRRRRAAAGVPHAFAGLHVRDATEDRRRLVGGRPDVLGEVVKAFHNRAVGHEAGTTLATQRPGGIAPMVRNIESWNVLCPSSMPHQADRFFPKRSAPRWRSSCYNM